MSQLSPQTELPPAQQPPLTAKDGALRMESDLQQAIEGGTLASGSRLRPLREFASHYRISVPTAQRVMARLESVGLVQRRQGAGVFVTHKPQPPAADASLAQAVLMLVSHKDPLFDRFAGRLAEGLTELGLQPVRPAWNREQIKASRFPWLDNWPTPPRAVIVQQAATGINEAIQRICDSRTLKIETFRLPMVPTLAGPAAHRVNPDYAAACRLAAEYFLQRGHRRIGFTTHRRPVEPAPDARFRKRWSGHTLQILELGRTLRQAGIHRHGLTLHYVPRHKDLKYNAALHPQNVERTMRWLSGPNRPTAVFGDDNRIAGILRAADQLGLRIGEDLEVLGQGNTDWSEALRFPSIDLQPELVADEVMALIRRDQALPLQSRHDIVVPVHLVER